jgi:hypothetical protein
MATPLLMSEFLDRFGRHAATSEAMAGKTNMDVIPQYGFQTGYDFQKNFPGLNPKISSGLAAGYQTLQEGTRALLDGPGGITLKDAFDTAKKQAAENIEGILAADSGNITAKQLANRNAYLANQGFLNNEEGIVNTAGNRINDFLNNLFFTTAYAPEVTEEERKSIERQPPSFRSLSDSEVYGDLEERKNLLERILDLGKGLGGGIVDAAKGAGNVLSNLGIVSALRNLDQFKNLSPIDQQFILSQAGGNRPMKDAFGYNIRSARGNYAQLVKDRAKIADFRKSIGKPIRAIDRYYLDKEKERQKQLQQQIEQSISEGRSMQRGYEDTYSSMGYSSPAERAADTPTGTLGRV